MNTVGIVRLKSHADFEEFPIAGRTAGLFENVDFHTPNGKACLLWVDAFADSKACTFTANCAAAQSKSQNSSPSKITF